MSRHPPSQTPHHAGRAILRPAGPLLAAGAMVEPTNALVASLAPQKFLHHGAPLVGALHVLCGSGFGPGRAGDRVR